jgi:hypothetical protein
MLVFVYSSFIWHKTLYFGKKLCAKQVVLRFHLQSTITKSSEQVLSEVATLHQFIEYLLAKIPRQHGEIWIPTYILQSPPIMSAALLHQTWNIWEITWLPRGLWQRKVPPGTGGDLAQAPAPSGAHRSCCATACAAAIWSCRSWRTSHCTVHPHGPTGLCSLSKRCPWR